MPRHFQSDSDVFVAAIRELAEIEFCRQNRRPSDDELHHMVRSARSFLHGDDHHFYNFFFELAKVKEKAGTFSCSKKSE